MKKTLWRETGYASAYALPALIPLCWSETPLPLPDPPPRLEAPIVVAKPMTTADAIYLSLADPDVVEKIAYTVRADRSSGTNGLFRIRPGVFLCINEDSRSHGDIPDQHIGERTIRWGSCALITIEVRTFSEPATWWEHVIWEEKERVRLRSPL